MVSRRRAWQRSFAASRSVLHMRRRGSWDMTRVPPSVCSQVPSRNPRRSAQGPTPYRLAIDEAARTALANRVPIAFAVTYLVGVIAAAWFLSQMGPRILGVDLAAECRTYEAAMAGGATPAGQVDAWRQFDIRTFEIKADSRVAGRTVGDVEGMFAGCALLHRPHPPWEREPKILPGFRAPRQ